MNDLLSVVHVYRSITAPAQGPIRRKLGHPQRDPISCPMCPASGKWPWSSSPDRIVTAAFWSRVRLRYDATVRLLVGGTVRQTPAAFPPCIYMSVGTA
jgi:hypothetical protein